jgi:DNA polymerase III gamma/tau subunit
VSYTIFCVIAEADMQKLSHALKILSETEKQVRMSKNQTTWLTVALLQLSSMESSSLDSKLCLRNVQDQGEDHHNDCFLINYSRCSLL